jgi:hypothetical protein
MCFSTLVQMNVLMVTGVVYMGFNAAQPSDEEGK